MFLVTPASSPLCGSILLLHGSGAPMRTPFMDRAAQLLAAAGLEVSRAEFAYMASGKKAPPSRFEALQAEFRHFWQSWPGPGPRLVGGKSLGGRVAVSLAQELDAAGVVCFGYPFHPPGQPERTRLQMFAGLTRPCLVLQGTRDPFGCTEEVAGYPLPASVEIAWLEGAGHGFETRKGWPDPWATAAHSLNTWVTQKVRSL